MNKPLVREWIAALRSGAYKQGQGLLHNSEDEYCCLGVLCEVVKERLHLSVDKNEEGAYRYDKSCALLPNAVSELLYQGYSRPMQYDPIHWNDGLGLTFPQIADKLEALIAE